MSVVWVYPQVVTGALTRSKPVQPESGRNPMRRSKRNGRARKRISQPTQFRTQGGPYGTFGLLIRRSKHTESPAPILLHFPSQKLGAAIKFFHPIDAVFDADPSVESDAL